MRTTSSAARLHRSTIALLVIAAGAWALWRWDASPVGATLGAIAILLSFMLLMAIQCMLLFIVSRRDPPPRPGIVDVLRAWWGEVLQVPRVFFWRLPFRWRSYPDVIEPSPDGVRGVVFIHGFICNRGFWNPWLRRLRQERRPYIAINLEPMFGPIDEYAAVVDEAVRKLEASTGLAPALICHSMGGLVARAWLRHARDPARVHRIITIGSPHRGTWLGRFSRAGNGVQMRWENPWLGVLAQDELAQAGPPFTCWYSTCDNIVFPTRSATLPSADNRLVLGPAYVELAFVPEVMKTSLALVDSA